MKFEGEEVAGRRVVIRQYTGDIDTPLTVDETVEITVVAKVIEVTHQVNQRTGELNRVHILRVKEVDV
jgi:hypothetical protein